MLFIYFADVVHSFFNDFANYIFGYWYISSGCINILEIIIIPHTNFIYLSKHLRNFYKLIIPFLPKLFTNHPSRSIYSFHYKHNLLLKKLIFESRLCSINHTPKRGLERFRGITADTFFIRALISLWTMDVRDTIVYNTA